MFVLKLFWRTNGMEFYKEKVVGARFANLEETEKLIVQVEVSGRIFTINILKTSFMF